MYRSEEVLFEVDGENECESPGPDQSPPAAARAGVERQRSDPTGTPDRQAWQRSGAVSADCSPPPRAPPPAAAAPAAPHHHPRACYSCHDRDPRRGPQRAILSIQVLGKRASSTAAAVVARARRCAGSGSGAGPGAGRQPGAAGPGRQLGAAVAARGAGAAGGRAGRAPGRAPLPHAAGARRPAGSVVVAAACR
ncbi:hypothetical protein HF086_006678 [Spodoptera exigua]|uniref:Uncharacterized protein n=1 Tax=Spodoptera exigua TaxID=7107 RepID=A0A922MUP5_SPOEX|nr:hypothetical protein HF086_006678 [Spodoptera exigua]